MMSKGMPTAPSAPLVDDQHLVGHHAPPPNYDQAMGHPPVGFVPLSGQPTMPLDQPGMAPYPQQQNYMPPVQMPQAQYHVPPPPQPAPVISQTTVIVAGALPVGPNPARVRCPVCHMDIKTTTVSENQAGAHIACIVLCLLGCCLCSCIPYCMDSCKSVRHTCPNCNSYLGMYKA